MTIVHSIAIALAAGLSFQLGAPEGPSQTPDIQGTWELVAQQVGKVITLDGSKPTKMREIKLIVNGHFVWVVYDRKHGNPDSLGGGTYRLNGDSYVETVEFASPKVAALVEKEEKFTVKFAGDRLTQSGRLWEGTELREIWQRVR